MNIAINPCLLSPWPSQVFHTLGWRLLGQALLDALELILTGPLAGAGRRRRGWLLGIGRRGLAILEQGLQIVDGVRLSGLFLEEPHQDGDGFVGVVQGHLGSGGQQQ